MTYVLGNGIGAALGDSLVTREPLTTTADIWYVDSQTGSNANNGRDRLKPLATLAQAYTNAAAGDIVTFLSGHTETITSVQALAKAGLILVGEGLSGGLPTVKFQMNAIATSMFTPSVAGVQMRNLWIQGNQQTNVSPRVVVTGAGFRMTGCYVECGFADTGAAISLGSGADSCRIYDTTIISTAALTQPQPESAIKSSAAVADLILDGLVLNAGTLGFSNFYAGDFSAAAITRLQGENVSLLNGADVKFHASTAGYFNAATVTGGSRVNW